MMHVALTFVKRRQESWLVSFEGIPKNDVTVAWLVSNAMLNLHTFEMNLYNFLSQMHVR